MNIKKIMYEEDFPLNLWKIKTEIAYVFIVEWQLYGETIREAFINVNKAIEFYQFKKDEIIEKLEAIEKEAICDLVGICSGKSCPFWNICEADIKG